MIIASMENVVKRFDNVQALDHVSFTMEKGEISGLLGPNGAGKTTLIRVIAGLIPADSGEVMLLGEKQNMNSIRLKKRMGLVTQEVTVFHELTAEENLRFFGGLYGLSGSKLKKSVYDTLEFVGLTEHARKMPAKFSGGMQRRLNIACALVHSPEFLIMDEPTVGIDPQSRNYILDSIKLLSQNGTSILYTSHYMEEVQAIAHRIAIMDKGHVIAKGTLEDLVNGIQHEETIQISVANPSESLLESFRAIQGVKSVIQKDNEYTILSGSGSGNLNRILTLAQKSGAVLNISADKPTLEDVFLTLTGRKLRDKEENA